MGKKKEEPKYSVGIQLEGNVTFYCEDHPLKVIAEKVASGLPIKVFQLEVDEEVCSRVYKNIIFMIEVLYVFELTDE